MKRLAAILMAVALLPGCWALGGLAKMATGAQWLGHILDAADAGAAVYWQRHPSMDGQIAYAGAMQRARIAVVGLSEVAAAQGAKDAAERQRAALAAYAALLALLDQIGITQGDPAIGGAEGAGPMPKRLILPDVGAVAAALGNE